MSRAHGHPFFAYDLARVSAHDRTIRQRKIFTPDLTDLDVKLDTLFSHRWAIKKSHDKDIALYLEKRQALMHRLNLTEDLLGFTVKEQKAVEDYLYANCLIVQCKQAAARVSPEKWREIEERMLLPLEFSP